MPTNAERADWALASLAAFNLAKGEKFDPDGPDLPDEIADLITDLMHLAHQRELGAEDIADRARDNFVEEHCDTLGCDGAGDDGEGYDGYCGNCADRREKG